MGRSGGSNDLAARTRELALALTAWPSVTGSAAEAGLAPRLAAMLGGCDAVWSAAIPGDAVGRSNVFALKRGPGRRTIMLTGHFDVVPVEDYGALKHLAFDAEKLLPALIARLGQRGGKTLR